MPIVSQQKTATSTFKVQPWTKSQRPLYHNFLFTVPVSLDKALAPTPLRDHTPI